MASAEVAVAPGSDVAEPGAAAEEEEDAAAEALPQLQPLSEEQIAGYFKVLKVEGDEAASSHLSQVLALTDFRFDARSAIKLDYATYALEFASSQAYGPIRSVAVYRLACYLLEGCAGGSSASELQQNFKARLLAMTSPKPGADSALLSPQQVSQAAIFFSKTLFRHYTLYAMVFSKEQAVTEYTQELMVETASVPSFHEAISEKEKGEKEEAEHAEKESKAAAVAKAVAAGVAEAEAKRVEQEAIAAEEARKAELLRKPATLDEAIQHLLAARLEGEKAALVAEYDSKEAVLKEKLQELQEKLPETPPEPVKGKKK